MTKPLLVALVIGIAALLYVEHRDRSAIQRAADDAAAAQVALAKLRDAQWVMVDLVKQRDSALRVADSAAKVRLPSAKRAAAAVQALGPEPIEAAPPCSPWVQRARQATGAASEALQALDAASAEIDALRGAIRADTTALHTLQPAIEAVEPVLAAHTRVRLPAKTPKILGLVPYPYVNVGYGGVLSSEERGLRFRHGPGATVGVKVSLGNLLRGGS